jgi:flagellar basal body-associated protein FliL
MTHESPHDKSADAVKEGRPVEAQYVRGGRKGGRILTVLVVSTLAVAILLLGMWFVSQGGFATTNANTGTQAVDAQAFDGDSATPPTPDAPTTATGEAPNVNAPTASAQPSQ